MKKIITVLLMLALSLGLFACGAKDEKTSEATETTKADTTESAGESTDGGETQDSQEEEAGSDVIKSNFEKAIAYAEAHMDIAEAEKSVDDADPNYLYCYWYTDAIVEPAELGKTITVDGNQIEFGKTTVKEIQELGYDVELPEGKAEPETIYSAVVSKDGKNFILSLEENRSAEAVPFDDLAICGFSTGIEEFSLPFDYQGLGFGSNIDDLQKAMGTPNASVHVSADDTFTSIDAEYFFEEEVEDHILATNFSISYRYDPETDSVTMAGMNYSMSEYAPE